MTNSFLVLPCAAFLLVGQAVAQQSQIISYVDGPSDNTYFAQMEHHELVEVESANIGDDINAAGNAISDELSDCCCCDLGPGWEFRAAWLYLTKEDPNNTPLLFNAARAVLFDASQLDFDWESGWEASAKRSLNCCWDLDMRYFQVDTFEATAFFQTVVGDRAFDGIGIALATDHSFIYDSELYSGEVNLLRTNCGSAVQFLAGFRYVRVEEELIQFLDAGIAMGTFTFETKNDLFGLQIGAAVDVYSQCGVPLSVNGFVKTGIYYADRESLFRTGADLAPFNLADDDDDDAFVGEVGLSAIYQVNHSMGIEASYQLLWIDGIALASEQPATTDPFGANATATNQGSVFYHGFNLGFVATW